jgi:hypothetical protein
MCLKKKDERAECARVEHLLSAAPKECRELAHVRVAAACAVLPHSAEECATLITALLVKDSTSSLASRPEATHADAAKCASTSTERYVMHGRAVREQRLLAAHDDALVLVEQSARTQWCT